MNKAELVEAIANAAGLSKSQADTALNATIGAIKAELGKGGSVSLIGFGSFSVGKRGARTGRNPATGLLPRRQLRRRQLQRKLQPRRRSN
jgi:DNA-binding protein HU-beta